MKTVGRGARLEMMRDGLDGIDLGVIGLFQYALVRLTHRAEVYRRRASEVGTYGGWRWECNADHPARCFASEFTSELAARIREAR